MKPFNLQEALEGKPIVTRDGRKVIDFYYWRDIDDNQYPIYAMIEGRMTPCTFSIEGKLSIDTRHQTNSDLFMYEEPKIYYANIYEIKGLNPYTGALYNSFEEAEKNKMIGKQKYLKTIQVTI